jgi:hypothetical protein
MKLISFWSLFYLCFVIINASDVIEWMTLTFQIESNAMECFGEMMSRGQTFEMRFQVTRGAPLLDISLNIKDPLGSDVWKKVYSFSGPDRVVNEQNGNVVFIASMDGNYEICFDNAMSKWNPRIFISAPKRIVLEVRNQTRIPVQEPMKRGKRFVLNLNGKDLRTE